MHAGQALAADLQEPQSAMQVCMQKQKTMPVRSRPYKTLQIGLFVVLKLASSAGQWWSGSHEDHCDCAHGYDYSLADYSEEEVNRDFPYSAPSPSEQTSCDCVQVPSPVLLPS